MTIDSRRVKIFVPEEIPAVKYGPMAFTLLETILPPTEITALFTNIGSHRLAVCFMSLFSSLQKDRSAVNIGFFIRGIRAISMETPWAITVASAPPATPQSKPAINKRSRTILITVADATA